MVPGYADVCFTGGKCEACGGEAQVTDTVSMNSPAPRTLIPRHSLSFSTWGPRAGPDWCELDLRLDTALPPPQQHFFQLHHSRKSLYSFQDLEDCPTLLILKPRAAATSTTPSPAAACTVGTRHSLALGREV